MSSTPAQKQSRAVAEEREIIDSLEKEKGCPLTEQEINLSLEQARAIGELPSDKD